MKLQQLYRKKHYTNNLKLNIYSICISCMYVCVCVYIYIYNLFLFFLETFHTDMTFQTHTVIINSKQMLRRMFILLFSIFSFTANMIYFKINI